MKKYKKKDSLLIIHQGALGDFVLALPVLFHLRQGYTIGIFCSEQNGAIADYLGLADKVFSIEGHLFSSLFFDPDPAMIRILDDHKKILLFSFADEPVRLLNSITKTEIFWIHPRPEPGLRIHVTSYIKSQLKELGLLREEPLLKIEGRRFDPKITTLIHPGAGSKRKRWRLSNFLKLYIMLRSEGIKTGFLIGPAEEDLYLPISRFVLEEELYVVHDMYRLLDLLESTSGIIGNDSGVVHLSAFLGIPTLAIFGPSDPLRWRPIGNKVDILRSGLGCRPCFEVEKENCANPVCLDINPEIVFKRYLRLIS